MVKHPAWKGSVKGRAHLENRKQRNVKVWEDNWIPRQSAQHPLGWLLEDPPDRVKDFLRSDGSGWDEDKLRIYLAEPDVNDVLCIPCIPVGRAGSDDIHARNFTKSGQFSVKAAYHLAVQVKSLKRGTAGSSISCDEHKGRLELRMCGPW
jgi:hypothetical protein